MTYDFSTATLETKSKDDIVRDMMAALYSLDALAREMERKWGDERLPSLVPDELSLRFYKQACKLREATRSGRDEDTITEAKRMELAWRTLDAEATRLGGEPIKPCVWEVRLSDGSVAAIVRDEDERYAVDSQGRAMRVYTLKEIARLLEVHPEVAAIKDKWPGATVQEARVPAPDPFFWDRGDEIPF